ncbi:hypothetical protein Tco_0537844 [Tanacetum coccineum]
MEVSLKSYVKDIFDRIDRNHKSNCMQISNIENLASNMSIQFSQLGAGNTKPRYESSIGVELEKMNVETIALGSRKCEFDHELEKVEVAHNVFDEMPRKNLGVVHKAFDEMTKENDNSIMPNYVKAESAYIGRVVDLHLSELKELKQVASVKEYHDCFIDCMVLLFKPQTIHEAYCLAKLQKATLKARKTKEPIKTTPLATRNIPKEGYFEELDQSVDYNAIPTDSQKCFQTDVLTLGQSQELLNLGLFVSGNPDLEIQVARESKEVIEAKILKQPGNVKDIKKLELNKVNEYGKVVEASLIKDNILRQPSDDLIVVENFEWKPGLDFWSVEMGRNMKPGSSEHGYDDVIKDDSIMVKDKFNYECSNESLKGYYFDRKFKGSYVGLADLISSIKELFATSFTDVSGQWYWDEIIKMLRLESDAKHLYMAAEFTKDLDALSTLSELFSVDFFSSQTEFKTFNIQNEMHAAYFLEELMINNKKKDVKRWLFEIKWKNLLQPYWNFQLATIFYQIWNRNLHSLLVQKKVTGTDLALLHQKTLISIIFECSFVFDGNSEKVLLMLNLLTLEKIHMEVQFNGYSDFILESDHVNFSKSQLEHILKINGEMVAGLEEWVIKNRLQTVDKWLVKWKWKRKKLPRRKINILHIGIKYLDP